MRGYEAAQILKAKGVTAEDEIGSIKIIAPSNITPANPNAIISNDDIFFFLRISSGISILLFFCCFHFICGTAYCKAFRKFPSWPSVLHVFLILRYHPQIKQ